MSFAVVLASLLVQCAVHEDRQQGPGTSSTGPWQVLRGFDPQLKRLLAADIFARLAEGMPRELIILFSVAVFVAVPGPASGARPCSARC